MLEREGRNESVVVAQVQRRMPPVGRHIQHLILVHSALKRRASETTQRRADVSHPLQLRLVAVERRPLSRRRQKPVPPAHTGALTSQHTHAHTQTHKHIRIILTHHRLAPINVSLYAAPCVWNETPLPAPPQPNDRARNRAQSEHHHRNKPGAAATHRARPARRKGAACTPQGARPTRRYACPRTA